MQRKNDAYQPPAYIEEALSALKPPQSLTVSEWAAKYRVLDIRSSATPGLWVNDVTPYLREIMDSMNDPDLTKVVFVKPTQVGGTECALNMLGYCVMNDPGPGLLVYPNDALAASVSKNRIRPMFQASEEMEVHYHQEASSLLELQFDSMYLALCGANSPGDVASRPIRYLFLDETDKYPPANKKESDPVRLASERVKTYANHFIFETSTPTIRENHIWKEMERADAIKHYQVPCPHCGEYIELDFDHLNFPSADGGRSAMDRAELAVYLCQECGAVINDRHKPEMLRNGRWEVVKQNAERITTVAFHLNTLYSPFVRFSAIVKEFLLSKDDPGALQNFRNSWLALPWEDLDTHTDADMVLARQTEAPAGVVPAWAELLTAGMDVQKHSVYYTIRAWGPYLTSQNILHGQSLSLEDAGQIVNGTFVREDGEEMVVALCGVDSGDQTDMVYEFCGDNPEWTIPVKGQTMQYDYFRLSQVDRPGSSAHGRRLLLVNGERYKDLIASRLRRENGPGTGSFMVHAGCDRDYAEQLTAEHKINLMRGGKRVQEWQKRTSHADNHYLDCEVYASCAADLMGVRNMHLMHQQGEGDSGAQSADEKAEKGWLQHDGQWL